MNSPLFVTISATLHTRAEVQALKAAGFTHISYNIPAHGEEWKETVDIIHEEGLKVAAWLPNWRQFPADPAAAFRTWNGVTADLAPSYWHPEAEAAILHDSQTEGLVQGLDAILVDPAGHDCPYPNFWPASEDHDFTLTRMFWSWDEAAQADWAAIFSKPMPRLAELDIRGQPATEPEFYRWYQQAWMARVYRITAWAAERGIKDIWTWLLPHNQWSAENMATGCADCFHLLDDWAQDVEELGCHPRLVMPCLWPTYIGFQSTAIRNTELFIETYGHDVIIGAETCHSAVTVAPHLAQWGPKARAIGAAGIIGWDRFILGDGLVVSQVRAERALWDEHFALKGGGPRRAPGVQDSGQPE